MPEEIDEVLSGDEAKIKKIRNLKEHYENTSRAKRQLWTKYYKAYNNFTDKVTNPYLSNLFIPKIHEAVELLAAFLAGRNQDISAEPEGVGDTKKAQVAEKLLDFIWRKVIFAHDKVVKWVKQSIIFGNGIMKVGWEDKAPWIETLSIEEVYMDYYIGDIQKTAVIHRIIKDIDEVKNDEKYNKNRENVVPISDSDREEKDSKMTIYDDTLYSDSTASNVCELLEYWSADNKEIVTIANTTEGYKILRDDENELKDASGKLYKPFIKMKFKTSPLPNRAYDIGAIEPSYDIQLAFNDAVREFLDNAMLLNNKQWIVRRGAKVAPSDLVRRPGGIVKVDDINADIKSEEVGDIKGSMFEMISFLDNEFQQASMVVNLLKGMGGADTATEAALGQQNVQTQLDLVDTNIKDAFNRLGQMLMDIMRDNMTEKMTIKIMEDDDEVAFMDVEPKNIKGKFDIIVTADRPATESKAVRQKQLLDFLDVIRADVETLQKYPELTIKIYKEWLRQAGFNDISYFFEQNEKETENPFGLRPGALKIPSRNEGLTQGGQMQSAINPAINPQTNI